MIIIPPIDRRSIKLFLVTETYLSPMECRRVFFIEEMLKNSKVFDRSVTIFDRDSAIDGKSIIYHGRFIPCRFSCQSREMYNEKTFYPSRERIEKKKRKYSNLVYDQHIHVSLILEL